MFLILSGIHLNFRLNIISLADVSIHLSGAVDMQNRLLTISLLDEVGLVFNSQLFALDGVNALQCFFIRLHEARLPAFPIGTGVRCHSIGCLRGIG